MLVEADTTIQTLAYSTIINGARRVVLDFGDYEYVFGPRHAMKLHHDLSLVLADFKPCELVATPTKGTDYG